jgi:hypothetical protein
MVLSHDHSSVQQWSTDDYVQHGQFGPNITRDEFEAGNRDIVWKALPDISIQLESLLADGELVAARGLGQGTHTGSDLFGVTASGKHVSLPKPTSTACAEPKSANTGYRSTSSACWASFNPEPKGVANGRIPSAHGRHCFDSFHRLQ